ncbi:hypothetical protein J9L78_000918 [Salmonella enterica]|nr:hypothetical protein [Salmonella enterica]
MAILLYVFPAPAGINRELEVKNEGGFGVPRASGDKPSAIVPSFCATKCSPRQRG